ncbi:hypothetical protein BJY16_006379 [Actinoplanes octamycinicus]|uniref:Uncharacterized protein n=1 Tax=Actinoplanes octamycinicus TaxID=135948 RepID=A0A7W7MAK5_9ACTN|nr:hypothetical protein [Actinoplanes octamycinicus]MBB4742920.1 hypothetical protein [Actinoplanes octamycinicus]GIE58227.1 hypothetical protein Aoc01nite_36290 [Actinoplanes octamycinicus]
MAVPGPRSARCRTPDGGTGCGTAAPELDGHDLAHFDAYTAVARLIVTGRETPAFTVRTAPRRPVLGSAEQLRLASA